MKFKKIMILIVFCISTVYVELAAQSKGFTDTLILKNGIRIWGKVTGEKDGSYYWSSTANGGDYAYGIGVSDGDVFYDYRINKDGVRCLRPY